MKLQFKSVLVMNKPLRFTWLGVPLAILWLLSITPVNAAQKNDMLSLSEAVQQTLTQHPSLQVFPIRQQQLAAQKQTANLKPAYVLGVEVENVAGTGQLSGVKSLETSVSLSSVLELGGKRLSRVELVEQNSDLINVERKIQALDLLGSVTRRYIDVLNSQERVLLAREGVSLAEATLAEVNKRVNAAIAPSADKGRAEAALEEVLLTLMAEQRQLKTQQMALANMWGSYQPSFERVSGSLYTIGEAIPFDVLFNRVQQNPQIELFATESRVRDAQVRLARTQQTADLTWSVGIRRNEGLNDTALIAGFSMPLFSQQRAQGEIEAALAARNEVSYRRQDALLQLHTQLYRAYSGREQAILNTQKLQEAIIPKLTQSLEQIQNGYQRGLYSYLDFLTVRKDLLSAKRSLIEASAAALQFETEIEQLTAEPLIAAAQ
ncbi:MAG: TolC family protein [Pseudomonadota bacterium]|nr:TolC family protein [Pseudomonadota bacterium]|tara:strand:+ start:49973 stop:51277 length:1305 start_codon:yes stop_codon:yes gene_type:complete